MAITDLYTLYAVNIATTSPTLIPQITAMRVPTGIQELVEASDGQVDPTYTAASEQKPQIGFTTSALATALGACGISGRKIDVDDLTDYGPVEFWLQKLAEGGTRAASGHEKLVINEGLLIPMQLQAQQGQNAELDLMAYATYDGSNNPLVLSSAVTTGTAGVSALWTVGPCSVNGTAISVKQISINFGINVLVEGSDGEVWPRYVAIISRAPRITIETPDVDLLRTLGLTGAAQSATDSVFYLRKRSEGGTLVADETEEHISLTVDEGRISVQNIQAQHGQTATATVQVTPTYDGTNAIIAIDTTAAIA